MAASTKPFVLKDLTLTLKKVGDIGAAVDYRCQLGKAQITPSSNTGSTQEYVTFCATHSDSSGGGTTFSLDLGGFQAYADVADLSVLLWEDAGEKYEFTLVPNGGTISATNPGFTGEVTLVEAPVAGTANTHATFEVSLPCSAKPAMITVPPVAANFDADEFAVA